MQEVEKPELTSKLKATINEIIKQTDKEKVYSELYDYFKKKIGTEFDSKILIDILQLFIKKEVDESRLVVFSLLNAFLLFYKKDHALTTLYKRTYESINSLSQKQYLEILKENKSTKKVKQTEKFINYKSFLSFLVNQFNKITFIDKKQMDEIQHDLNILMYKILEYIVSENLIEPSIDIGNVVLEVDKIKNTYDLRNKERLLVIIDRIHVFQGKFDTFYSQNTTENVIDVYAHYIKSLVIYKNYSKIDKKNNSKIDKKYESLVYKILLKIIKIFQQKEFIYLINLIIKNMNLKEKKLLKMKKKFNENNSDGINYIKLSNLLLLFILIDKQEAAKDLFQSLKIEIRNLFEAKNKGAYKVFVYSLFISKEKGRENIFIETNRNEEIVCLIYKNLIKMITKKDYGNSAFLLENYFNHIEKYDCKENFLLLKHIPLYKIKMNDKKITINENKIKTKENSFLLLFIIKMILKYKKEAYFLFENIAALKFSTCPLKEREYLFLLELIDSPFRILLDKIPKSKIPYFICVLLHMKIKKEKIVEYLKEFNNRGFILPLQKLIPFFLDRNELSLCSLLYEQTNMFIKEENLLLQDFLIVLKKNGNIFEKFKEIKLRENSDEKYLKSILNLTDRNFNHLNIMQIEFLSYLFFYLGRNLDNFFFKKLIRISNKLNSCFNNHNNNNYNKDIKLNKEIREMALKSINLMLHCFLLQRINTDYFISRIIRNKYFLKYYKSNQLENTEYVLNTDNVNTNQSIKINISNLVEIKIEDNFLMTLIEKEEELNTEIIEILIFKEKKIFNILFYLIYKINSKKIEGEFDYQNFLLLISIIRYTENINIKNAYKTYPLTIEYSFYFDNLNEKIDKKNVKKSKEDIFLFNSLNKGNKQISDIINSLVNYYILMFMNRKIDYSIKKNEYMKLYLLFCLNGNKFVRDVFIRKFIGVFYKIEYFIMRYITNSTIYKNSYELISKENKISKENLIKKNKIKIYEYSLSMKKEDIDLYLEEDIFSKKIIKKGNESQKYKNDLKSLKFLIPQNISLLKSTGNWTYAYKYLKILKINKNDKNKNDKNKNEEMIELVFLLILNLQANGGFLKYDLFDSKSQSILENLRSSYQTDIFDYKNIKKIEKTDILSLFLNTIFEGLSKEIKGLISRSLLITTFFRKISEFMIKNKTRKNQKEILTKNLDFVNKFIETDDRKFWFFGYLKNINTNSEVLQSAEKAPIKITFNYSENISKIFIFKSRDDCRQDNLAIQLIDFCKEIFLRNKIEISLISYAVIPIEDGGIIKMLENTISRHQVGLLFSDNLRELYLNTYRNNFQCKKNFLMSFVGYSLFCYIFNVKDRHNANILFDLEGNYIHIDFGFIFDISPGNLNLEPGFKLTKEVIDFLKSENLYNEFEFLFLQGFFILRDNLNEIIEIIESLEDLKFECFKNESIFKLKARMFVENSKNVVISKVLGLIEHCSDSQRTKWYDRYQKFFNNIQY